MHAKRAFVHWYVGVGVSEPFFDYYRNNIEDLLKDYEEAEIEKDEFDEIDDE